MHAIGKVVTQAVVSSLVKESISAAVRPSNSSGGNTTAYRNIEESVRTTVQGINDIKSTLHGIARKDLLACISFFNEGIVYLCQVFGEEITGSVNTVSSRKTGSGLVNTVRNEVKPGSENYSASTAWLDATSRIEALKLDLDDSTRRQLSDATERFKDARRKATKAFCNEALSTDERILAMRYRVAALLLEKVENPAEALGACRLCLEELHCMSAVKDGFARNLPNIQKDVYDMNSVICDVTQLVGHAGELLNWPCVVGRNGTLDPMHNERSRTLSGHRCVTWSFGQDGDEEHKLKFAWGITSNTRADVIVGDSVDHNIKVFDRKGQFLYLLDPFAAESQSGCENEIWNVTSDLNDNIYVLTLKRTTDGSLAGFSEVYVFNERAFLNHKFTLREGFRGLAIEVDDNNQVFVVGGTFSDFHNDVVEVYNNDGTFVRSFGKENLTNAQDITIANEDRVMVLDGKVEKCPFVQVFSAEGQFLEKFQVGSSVSADSGSAMAFHKPSETVLVATLHSENIVQVSMYSKGGVFVRSIEFKTNGVPFITGVTATAKGRIAVPGQNVVLFA